MSPTCAMKRENAGLNVWQAQQAYFSWLARNDPTAFVLLDPIITVQPDRLSFEVFSKDEGAYAKLGVQPVGLRAERGAGVRHHECGLQPAGLFEGLQQMRSYRTTQLTIGREAVQLGRRVGGAGGAGEAGAGARLVAARLPAGAVRRHAAARYLQPRPAGHVQRAAAPAAARRSQGEAARPAHRARRPASRPGWCSSRGKPCSLPAARSTRARSPRGAASGAGAGSC